MLLYRENKITHKEISSFLRPSILIKKGYTKFVKHVQRGRFNNFYEWACLSFPEYKDVWKLDDFYSYIAKDGAICDSLEEVEIYEFIKYNLGINEIEAIGTSFKGDFIFNLPNNYKDKWYCPDFTIKKENETIYIEYFGLYNENPPKNNKMLNSYKNKTLRKINFYNTQPFTFIYLFPKDIKNSFMGLIEKLNKLELIQSQVI
jgi:hypothetical protein